MRELIWRVVARIVTIPAITDWLIERSKRTPYCDIPSRDGSETYMRRWWVFNPYGKDVDGNVTDARWPRLPSIRVHHILLADADDHLHDHPWDARTILLRGFYFEETESGELRQRLPGYTGRLLFGQYHRIHRVPPAGVFTLFFTWKYRGTWGFKVNGQKVPYRQYLASRSPAADHTT